jgi:beta-lactam-binding protein with PASTA domain
MVPKLKGKKLAVARKTLSRAHCRVGKIKRKKVGRKSRGRVVAQGIKAGKAMHAGTAVALTVGR